MTRPSRIQKIEAALDAPGVVERLAGLPTADLTAVELAVAEARKERLGLRHVRQSWDRGGYVAPVDADARELRRVELALLDEAREFEAVELSPLAPLGSCSTFSVGGQNRVQPAARGFELLADPTNILALECARRRRSKSASGDAPIRLAAVARCLRTQPLEDPSHSRHFSMMTAVTAGRSDDSRRFSTEVVTEHLLLHARLHEKLCEVRTSLANTGPDRPATRLQLKATDDYAESLSSMVEQLAERRPSLPVTTGELDHAYYSGVRFQLWIELAGVELPISDGGRFDWLQTLCSDRKEQLVCSGMGAELGVRIRSWP